jgi:prepilin-type N-terminal cleavage/methylation domain-containing protein
MRAAAERWIARRLEQQPEGDRGFTMIEIVVVMTIMTIVLVIFTGGITQAFSAESKVDTSGQAQGQIVTAFQRLDREVRYATNVSTPGFFGSDATVEFLTTYTGASICTEVRLKASTSQLQQRTWTQGSAPGSAWQQLADNVTPGTTTSPSTTPFKVTQPGSVYRFARMEVTITSTYGVNKDKSSKGSDVTFTALNTSGSSVNSTICTEGRGISW